MDDKLILRVLADNEALMNALRQLIDAQFEAPLSDNMTDAELGQHVRARLTAKAGVDAAFREVARYKTEVSKKEGINPAR